jgi:crotonobetainyl-CoA:carnitine CoA-transferase CaiB-like acyl-CoA transferase
MSLTGSGPNDPQRVGVPIADLLAGLNGTIGVLAALHERHITGRGKSVKTSLLASVVGVHSFQGTAYTAGAKIPRAQGNHHPSIAPYGLFRCADGLVQISVGSPKLWTAFCSEFQLDPCETHFATNAERVENRDELIKRIEELFSSIPVDALLGRLNQRGIPSGRLRTMDQVYEWDQLISQGLLWTLEHPKYGPIRVPGSPLRFFNITQSGLAENDSMPHAAPPMLGEHNQIVDDWLMSGDAAPLRTHD